MDHKSGKWAEQILSQRNEDGLWGNFHTLSQPVSGKGYTTEQALRRLRILGYTAEEEPIRRVMERMEQCIRGERKIDDYYERKHDWPLFEKLMLAAWLHLLDPQNETALTIARQWAIIVEEAFADGIYSEERDIRAFTEMHGRKPKSGFETGFGMFYHAALLGGVLQEETEGAFLDYYLSKPEGMFYIYDKRLNKPPEVFASVKSNRYLAALEVLADYGQAGEKLQFAADWLYSNREADGQWDFGRDANDKVYFPLSDSWRREEDRKRDCSGRIMAFLKKIER